MDLHTAIILGAPIVSGVCVVHSWVSWLRGESPARTALSDASLALAAGITALSMVPEFGGAIGTAGAGLAIIGASSFKIWDVRRTREAEEALAEAERSRLEPAACRPPSGRDTLAAPQPTGERVAVVREITHRGVRVLVYNFSGTRTREEALARVDAARGAAQRYPQGSLRTLTDVHDTFVDDTVISALGALARSNAPHVFASAVIGAGTREPIRQLIAGLAGRRFESFKDEASALDWLVSVVPAD